MTKFLVLIVVISLNLVTNGQNNSDILGRWKVVSASSKSFYFNFKTDSVYLSSELKSLYPDSLRQQRLLLKMKNLYGSFQFLFETKGSFKQYMDTSFLYDGRYKILPREKVLMLSIKNSLGKESNDTIPYSFNENMLLITIKQQGENIDYLMERR